MTNEPPSPGIISMQVKQGNNIVELADNYSNRTNRANLIEWTIEKNQEKKFLKDLR